MSARPYLLQCPCQSSLGLCRIFILFILSSLERWLSARDIQGDLSKGLRPCNFCMDRYFLPGKDVMTQVSALFCVDADDPEFRKGPVPIRRDGVKDEPEVLLVSGSQRGGGNRFDVNIWVAHPDQLE